MSCDPKPGWRPAGRYPETNKAAAHEPASWMAMTHGTSIQPDETARVGGASRTLSLDQLRDVVDNTPVAVWSCLPDGSADFLNQRWLTYLSLAPDGASGLGWSTLLHPDDIAGHLQRWHECVRTESNFEHESRFRRHDGVYRWFLARAEPVRDETGRIVRWCGTNIDIEDRKQAENALRRNETYLSEAQRLSKTGSFSWTIADGRMHWSTEAYRIFELESSFEPSVAVMLARVHPDDLDALRRAFVALEVDESLDLRCRLLMSDKRVKQLRIVGRVIGYAGRSAIYAGAFMDVTDAKLAEERLYRAQTALAHVTRVLTLGELAASIAHEMNQPLAGIVSNGEACARWLDRENPELAEVRSSVTQMVADCRRAAEVLRRLRTLVRKADPEYVLLNLNEVVAETVPLIQREIATHRGSLQLHLFPELSSIRGDKIQLQQVIINLVVNGLQAMDCDDGHAHVLTVRTQSRSEGGVTVSIVDSGPGIDDESFGRLFDPFFTTKPSGLGMGLSICRSIIEAHDGEIWASNNPERGATVSFSIPSAPHGDAAGV